ncbi:protein stoned-b [Plakobranchus ocellatus]|uniref:Protein stoned-b n=1 Tax=Plakobranchus ocellatus TaxID=259542 RepID=A0AAV3ZRG4_9GAST|nr:protein stoned-b [Plakobranchus ocellatus]
MSTGSYDESSNLVKDSASPPFASVAPGLDDVFEIGSRSSHYTSISNSSISGSQGAEQSQQTHLDAAAFSTHKSKHGSPFKKSKTPKGLGFLIKAREGAKKGKTKSPSKHKSKKHVDELDFDDLPPEGGSQAVDDSVKAKSEHWQAFLQMQDRIKQNVLKTQTSIGKLTAGRISPSGRISPGKGRDDDDQTATILSEEDDDNKSEELHSSEILTDSHSFTGTNPFISNPQLSHLSTNPEISVSSPSTFCTNSTPAYNFDMDTTDTFGDSGLGFDSFSSKTVQDNSSSVMANKAVDEFDLLGLNSDPAPPPAMTNHSSTSKQSSFSEDLLGLDDFLSQPASRDMSQDNLQSMDWFGGSTQSSAQSSLCPSPVQFDLDLLTSQGRLAPDSTAVSDLARSLVDDFLQWGAGNNAADDAHTGNLSKNPFQSDDFTAEEQVLKPNAFNPFATIVESDDVNFGSDMFSDHPANAHPRRESGGDSAAFTAFDPFAPIAETSAEPLDPFLDINANAAPTEAHVTVTTTTSSSSLNFQNTTSKTPQSASRKSSRKQSNPFLITEDDFVDGEVTFDDDFFASRGIFHASAAKDLDSIWGVNGDSSNVTADSTDAFNTAANPFQDDSFTAENVPVSDASSTIAQPINPFLTASFENIASQTQVKPLAADNPFADILNDSVSNVPDNTAQVETIDDYLIDDRLAGGPTPAPATASNITELDFDPFSPRPSAPPDNIAATTSNQHQTADLLADTFGAVEKEPEPSAPADGADDDDDFFSPKIKLDIKEKSEHLDKSGPVPMLPPPPKAPKSPQMPHRENPFDKASPPEENFASFAEIEEELKKKSEAEAAAAVAAKENRDRLKSVTSEDSTPEEEGPLVPLEPFHAVEDTQRDFWKLMVRHPTKKKLAGNRFWKATIIRLGTNKDGPVLRLFMEEKDTEPFQVS